MFDNTPETEAFVESDDKVVTVLRKAAQYIRDHGWCQFSRQCDERACARGALMWAATGSYWGEVLGLAREAEMAVLRRLATDYRYLSSWNDEAVRTATEVIDALEQAALHRARSLKTGV